MFGMGMPMSDTSRIPTAEMINEHTLKLLLQTLQLQSASQQQQQQPLPSSSQSSGQANARPQLRNPNLYINPAVVRSIPQKGMGASETPTPEDQYKTAMCVSWLMEGRCPYEENCKFAHGEDEMRTMKVKPQPKDSRKFKTKTCEKYLNGICPYGTNCWFIHPDPTNELNKSLMRYMQASSQLHPSLMSLYANNYPMNDLIDFSASVPEPFRFPQVQSRFSQSAMYPSRAFPSSNGHAATTFSALNVERDLSSPSSDESVPSSSSSGKIVMANRLREQVLKLLDQEKVEDEEAPQEEPTVMKQRDFKPFEAFELVSSPCFSKSFPGFKR